MRYNASISQTAACTRAATPSTRRWPSPLPWPPCNALLGDPDFVSVPLAPLLSAAYGAERRRGVGPSATPSSEVSPGLPRREGEHTTHLAVVDADGAAVGLTTTINDVFGSGDTVSGAGFLLNDEMDDFTTDPGRPNLFGLVQGEANAIAPNERMLSSMAPSCSVPTATFEP